MWYECVIQYECVCVGVIIPSWCVIHSVGVRVCVGVIVSKNARGGC